MDATTIWIIGAVVLFFGSWVQTTIGFGLAVVAAPILVWVAPTWIPIVLTSIALLLSFINTWNQRKFLNIGEMVVPMITRIPGTILGVWLLAQISVNTLQILVSVTVLMAVFVSYSAAKFEANKTNLAIAGAISGVTGSTTAIGGPPMAVIMQHGSPNEIRANLSLYFTYSCILSLIGYYWVGMLDAEIIMTSLSFVPVMLLGFFFGIKSRKFIDAEKFRLALLFLCLISGVGALIGALI